MAQRGTVANLLVQMRVEMGQLRLDLQNVQKEFNTTFGNLQRTATQFGAGILRGLAAGFTTGAIIAFGKSVVDLAGHLTDLSQQTGISAQTLSGIKSTLEESGTSLDAFANGVFKAQKELGEIQKETDPAAVAIKRLGLNLNELKRATPEEFIKLVTEALAKLPPGYERASLATALLSKSSRELVPGLVELAGKFDQLRAQGINEKDIAKLDQFGDALTRLGNHMRILAAGPLAEFLDKLEKLFKLTDRAKLEAAAENVQARLSSLDKTIRQQSRIKELGLGFLVPKKEEDRALQRRTELEADLLSIREQLDRLDQGGGPPTGKAAPPPPVAADRTAQNALESFVAGLRKQADALGLSAIELTAGGAAAREYGLNLEFAAARQKALDDPKLRQIVPEMEKQFRLWGTEVLKAGDNLDVLKARLADQAVAIRRADEETAKYETGLRDLAAIQDQLRLDSMTPLEREVAEVNKKFDEQRLALVQAAAAANITGEALDELIQRLETLRQQETLRINPPDWVKGFDAIGNEPIGPADTRRQQAVEDMKRMFEDITNSISQGIHQTVVGIQTGQLTLSEGLNNMFRNALLSVSETILDKAFLDPLKGVVNAFFAGFAEVFAEAGDSWAQTMAKDFGRSLGGWLKETMSSMSSQGSSGGGGGGFFGWLFGAIGGLFKGPGFGAAERGGLIRPGLAFAGLPQFAMGGPVPAILHGGEFVLNKRSVDRLGQANVAFANSTGRWPKSGGSKTDVIINGDITPRRAEMTPEQVIQVVTRDFDNRGPAMNMFEQRTLIRGGA